MILQRRSGLENCTEMEQINESLKDKLSRLKKDRDRILDEIKEVYKESLLAPEAEKAEVDYMSKAILETEFDPEREFDFNVNKIEFDGQLFERDSRSGRYVRVRPCAPGFENKTYLGIYLGSFNLTVGCSYARETSCLQIRPMIPNPCILIPSLGKIVFGAESWWVVVNSEEDLRSVSDKDIDSQFYVQALKSLTQSPEDSEAPASPH